MSPNHGDINYDSDNDVQPRLILDCFGKFTTRDGRATFRFNSLHVRPVPDPEDIHMACRRMGDGLHGVWTGTKFDHVPHDIPPQVVFAIRPVRCAMYGVQKRFCIRQRYMIDETEWKTMMIYTDGACSFNGRDGAKGGYAFVFNHGTEGSIKRPLEKKGADGQFYRPTSNRAELQAVIAARKYRPWWEEGWTRIVITTDSEYVGKGACEWLRGWARKDWRGSRGGRVVNCDLWMELSDTMGSLAQYGCKVSFWVVPRYRNTLADTAAKAAAQLPSADETSNMRVNWY